MSDTDLELLARYTRGGAEDSFSEVVRRHLDLVHSAALRQVRSPQLAEEVAQSVFIKLARHAHRLAPDTILTAWLYQVTRREAIDVVRREARRQLREQIAVEMNAMNANAADWTQIEPLLDEAMHALDDTDRTAVLLRFFENKSLREVGETLGTTDDTARKRVNRAIERLREFFAKRGVTVGASGLVIVISANAVQAAPVSVEQSVQTAALAATKMASAPSLAATILALALMVKTKLKPALVAGLAVLTTVTVLIGLRTGVLKPTETVAPTQFEIPPPPEIIAITPSIADLQPTANSAIPELPSADESALSVTLVAAETGQRIPDGEVQWSMEMGSKSSSKTLRSDREGVVRLPVDTNTALLELTTRIEGFADTQLSWRTDRGEKIPRDYTLRLGQPVFLGGWVVDASGGPVSGAKVELHGGDAQPDTRPEFPVAELTATTDESGRWRANRIAPKLVRQLWIQASHPALIGSERVNLSVDPEIERQFRDGAHIFQLGAATLVRGRVLDTDGQPVADATIVGGRLHYKDTRETKTAPDGSFALAGCPIGKLLLTAQAKGFAPTAIEPEVNATSAPVTIILTQGRPLPVRVVDRGGNPLATAAVWVVANQDAFRLGGGVQPQFRLEALTDAEGRVQFTNLPDCALWVGASLRGYMWDSSISARAGESELVVSLYPALTVTGTVRDNSTGQGVPKFRVVAGRPKPTGPYWSTIDRFQLNFEGGSFRHVFDEGVTSPENPGYMLKFEARGYMPFVSRIIAPDEGVAELDVVLQPVVALQITVINPDQTPATFADVGLVDSLKLSDLHLVPGGFDRRHADAARLLEKTDEQGRIKPELGKEVGSIIVANSSGYVEASASELQDGAVIRLQPWGHIIGALPPREGQQEMSEVKFEFDPQRANVHFAEFNSGFRITPDSRGVFEFPLAPPGRHRIVELVRTSKKSWTQGRVVEVEVRAGKTTGATFATAESKAEDRKALIP